MASSKVLNIIADELETQPALWRAAAALREDGGHGVTDAWPASEHRLARGYDRVIALTRSGTTSEIRAVLDEYPATVITADRLRSLTRSVVLDG